MSSQITSEHLSQLCRFSTDAHTIADAIYNSTRMVGNKKLTADQALHLLIEYEHLAHRLGNEILEFKRKLQEGGEK